MVKTSKRMRRDARTKELFYSGRDYLSGYIAHTEHRVSESPQKAIGGYWEELGQLQYEFLVEHGLAKQSRMLDIGCGTLRGGRHFIRYLDAEGYTGIDIAPSCVEAGWNLVHEEGLTDKSPRLILNETRSMDFNQFTGETFDFLLAQSVFTHLPEELIDECFAHVGRVMHENSAFFFTYIEGPRPKQVSNKDFVFPFKFFVDVAGDHGFALEDLSRGYPHPRSQKMVRATLTI